MSDVQFEPFPKIARLQRDCTITEKIDGTNAQLFFDEVGNLFVGSRNRWLTPGKATDNYGFAAWALDHAAALFETLGVGRHYGEWWGVGINRGYGLHERRLSLFNPKHAATDFAAAGLPNVGVVPQLYIGEFKTETVFLHLDALASFGSAAAPGFMKPEGVVVFHHHARHLYKVTLGDNDGVSGKGARREHDVLPAEVAVTA